MGFCYKRNILVWSMFVFALSLMASCNHYDSSVESKVESFLTCSSKKKCPEVDLQDEFILVRSSKQNVALGTNLKSAKASERPEMKVEFTYDYQLGQHEVTCGEFNDLMGGKKGRVSLDCEKKNLPAVNVTYLDAVLYANAKSKAAGMDTAYTYSSLELDKKGHCVLMEGLKFDPDVEAFRLPTEAEWVYAAGLAFNVDNSWNASNSDFESHEVCKKKDDNGFCDLLGNVTEWVNDWLGSFREETVTNFIGATNGGSHDERVIKGGSFNSIPQTINLYARGDVYTVTEQTASNYLGFRLAYGKIENAVLLNTSGDVVSSNVSVVVGKNKISSILGTSRAKLAFRNDVTKKLSFIDFTKITPTVVEIKDSIDVYHPDISPDGKRVAFCTSEEGVGGKSEVYVRDLNESGSNLVKLDVKSATIPRWRVLDNGDTVIVYVTDAGNNEDKSSFFAKSTWQVKFANGKFDGTPVKLFDGAYHGGISDDSKLTVSGARLLRARVASKKSTVEENAQDTIWYAKEQACNASLNKTSKQTLFLDFMGEPGIEFVGEDYNVHERMFVMDSTGKLLKSVKAPKNWAFDHSEWVLHDESMAIATLTNVDGAHQKIVLVNVDDNTITEIAEGEELWHPCFWKSVNNASSDQKWSADSVGQYLTPKNQTYYLLANKMPMFWQLKDSVEVVGLGNSHLWVGFAAPEMSKPSINMGIIPCDMHCAHYLFSNYVLNHCSKLKYVVLGLGIDWWWNGDERTDVNMSMNSALGYEYDRNHEFYPDGVDDEFLKLIAENASPEADYVKSNLGWYPTTENSGWYDENGVAGMSGDSTWSDCLFNKSLAQCLVNMDQETCVSNYHMDVCVADSSLDKCLAKSELSQCSALFSGEFEKLKDVVRLAKERDITVVGVLFPISPYYKKTGAYGRHGLRRSHAEKLIEEIENLADIHSNFYLMNENNFGDHDYPTSMASDFDHLNKDGAKRVTAKIDSLIKSIDGKSKK